MGKFKDSSGLKWQAMRNKNYSECASQIIQEAYELRKVLPCSYEPGVESEKANAARVWVLWIAKAGRQGKPWAECGPLSGSSLPLLQLQEDAKPLASTGTCTHVHIPLITSILKV